MTQSSVDPNPLAARALDFIPEGSIVGLGTGRAASAFLVALAAKVQNGFGVRGVATSLATEFEARRFGIPLISIRDIPGIDIAVDGADEVAPTGDLIKGYGGALLREKIVASLARKRIFLVGEEKLVPALGHRGRLPIEVVPFAEIPVQRAIEALGFRSQIREVGSKQFVTDNGNWILDVAVVDLSDPLGLEIALRSIPGIVGTGLFLAFRSTVFVQSGSDVRELKLI